MGEQIKLLPGIARLEAGWRQVRQLTGRLLDKISETAARHIKLKVL